MSILDQESLTWYSVDAPPDDSVTVMVYAPQADEPVWLGYYDEGRWFEVGGGVYPWVEAWAPMPAGATAGKS